MLVLRSLLPVAVITALLITIVSYDIFRPIKVDLGFAHYAEKPESSIGPYTFPEWTHLKMPLNTMVNAGYVIVGLYWIVRTYRSENQGTVGSLHAYFAYTFGWMGVFYGPIQYARIVTQTHQSAVLDQWVTSPFFAWLILWSKSLLVGWDLRACLIIVASSLLSYNLVFFTDFGFEIVLLLHTIYAISAGLDLHRRYPCEGNFRTIILVSAAFTIFVVFKLLDLYLPQYGDIFTVVSGHFLSKLLGDIGQIYFTFAFFERVAMTLRSKECAKQSSVVNSKKMK